MEIRARFYYYLMQWLLLYQRVGDEMEMLQSWNDNAGVKNMHEGSVEERGGN